MPRNNSFIGKKLYFCSTGKVPVLYVSLNLISLDPDHLPLLLGVLNTAPIPLTAYVALALSVLLLFCSAFVSGSEVAFFSLSPKDLDEIKQSNAKADQNILKLLETPQALLASILIANNFVNIVIIILLTHFTLSVFDFSGAPVVGFVVQTIVITFLLLLFGEIMPKVYANQAPKRTARRAAGTFVTLEKVLAPFIKLLIKSTSAVDTRMNKHSHNNISMDELSEALELTTAEQDEDKDMLEGIIKFGNIQVSDIMCSRLDIVGADIKCDYQELMRIIIDSGYSRIPVYTGTSDKIKGLIYSKDLLPYLDKPRTFRWQTLIRPAYFVPESKKIDDLLREFQENKVHLAIVVDEYGGTSGLVTMEDILEEIVGDISDEYDEEETLYTKVDDNTYVFEAKILLNDFYKITDIEPDTFANITTEVETLAGLVLELKGDIPKSGEKISYGQYDFEVMAVDKRRIKKIRFHINERSDENDTENGQL